MNVKSNVARLLTLLVGSSAISIFCYKWISLLNVPRVPFSNGTCKDPGSFLILILFTLFALFMITICIPYETRLVKPKSVLFYKFPSHVAIVIDNDRIFTYKEKSDMYHLISDKTFRRLSCWHQSNLFWFEMEKYTLMIDSLPTEEEAPGIDVDITE